MATLKPIVTLAFALTTLFAASTLVEARSPRARIKTRPLKRMGTTLKGALRRLTRPLRPQPAPKTLDWRPSSPKAFDIVGLVKGFQGATPKRIKAKLAKAPSRKLADAHSVSFIQRVDDKLGKGPKRAAVHITRGTVDMPLGRFLKRVPAEKWGRLLDHYIGGVVKVARRGRDGKAIDQVERMVLTGLPGDLNIRALNLDMTKVERKVVDRDASGKVKRVTMFWRVHSSANRTTIMDVGSVAFEALANGKTQVTFHSAHRLGKNGLQLPNMLVGGTLRSFFSDHIRHYRKLATQ